MQGLSGSDLHIDIGVLKQGCYGKHKEHYTTNQGNCVRRERREGRGGEGERREGKGGEGRGEEGGEGKGGEGYKVKSAQCQHGQQLLTVLGITCACLLCVSTA